MEWNQIGRKRGVGAATKSRRVRPAGGPAASAAPAKAALPATPLSSVDDCDVTPTGLRAVLAAGDATGRSFKANDSQRGRDGHGGS